MKQELMFDATTGLLALALGLLMALILAAAHARCAQAGCRRCSAIVSGATARSLGR